MILNASERSIDLEYDLFIQVREQLSGQVSRLQRLSEGIARLDVLLSFARVSLRHQFVRPKLHHADRLWIKEGRHPVVELGMKQGKFVANDVELDQKERQILLITGPNMAGKSTYMRQVALMVILGQIGCFVPAAAAEIPIVDRIFTRIGAADDLAGGRSTFMVEMTETCQALREATPHSLILFDEVGRGTSTYDGMALAYAIVEYIHQYVGAKMLFSTHYHELTELESELNKLVNIHAGCTEKEGKVIFLHRMLPGKADRSYGIQVAELAGLPEQVIQKAQSRLQELEENGAEVTNGVSTPHAQLSLFAPSSEPNPLEQEVLEKIQKWDVFNHTPLDTMQFLHRLQQRLSKQGG